MRWLWRARSSSADPSAMPYHALTPIRFSNREDGAATQTRCAQSQAAGTKLRQRERDILVSFSSIKTRKRGKAVRKIRKNHTRGRDAVAKGVTNDGQGINRASDSRNINGFGD